MRPLPPDPLFRAALLSALAACGQPRAGASPRPAAPEPVPEARAPAPDERLAAPGTIPGSPELPPAVGCGMDHQALPGGDLSPARPTDAWLLRFGRAGIGAGAQRDVARTEGRVCGTATDKAACMDSLGGDHWPAEALRRDCGQVGCTDWHLAWTAGDETGVVTDRAALLAFLGPIDTVGEVSLLVWVDGYTPACEPSPARDGDTWTASASRRISDCPIKTNQYRLRIGADGALTVLEEIEGPDTGACIGRLPPGLPEPAPPEADPGAWLAWAARLEAASVPAFRQLAAELSHHGAPEVLVSAALAAAEDEVRHAGQVGALARRYGVEPGAPEVPEVPLRSLEALAADNAAEGCVREAIGAAVGCWQARRATDPEVRRVMAAVADDEIQHAELSRAIHRWVCGQLDPRARRRVEAARRRAARRLRRSLATPLPRSLAGPLGLPSGPEALALACAVLAAA